MGLHCQRRQTGHSQDIFASPVPTSVQQQPSTSTVGKSVSRPVTKRKRATQEDVIRSAVSSAKGTTGGAEIDKGKDNTSD
jgi:hypothetical protein